MRSIKLIKVKLKQMLRIELSPEERALKNEDRIGLNGNIFENIKYWGVYYEGLAISRKILRKIGKEQLVLEHWHEYIEKHLKKCGSSVLNQAFEKNHTDKPLPIGRDSTIWLCWWDGAENAPELVVSCINSIIKNAGSHPVKIITRDNFKSYADIPSEIIKKWERGYIGAANFADILRCTLLYRYGGIWLDTTIYMSGGFPEELYGRCFYSFKRSHPGDAVKYVAKGRWGSYFLASGQNNPLMGFARDMQYAYWSTAYKIIDYGLIDYCIDLAYRELSMCREMIDGYPPGNPRMHSLYLVLEEPYSEKEFRQMCKNTYLFKLSYKKTFPRMNRGCSTYYNELIIKKDKNEKESYS